MLEVSEEVTIITLRKMKLTDCRYDNLQRKDKIKYMEPIHPL
jgi:hypothetical protein